MAIVILAHARHASSAEATNVSSADATHGTCAEAATAPVSSAEASTTATATAAPTTARLCTRRKQRPGQQGCRQYQHRSSSSHDIFLSMAGAISDQRTSRSRPIWSAGSQSLTGNFERIDRSSRSRRASTSTGISTERNDADQLRRIDKYRAILLTGIATRLPMHGSARW